MIATLVSHRKRGLWLLLGAPLALFWPGFLMWWIVAGPPLRLF